ncbi:hypothetical protein WD019_10230 [Fictibacillus sp. Mic-4]|uniref:hypothetical protein n=1 Tax=Fictibacillus sp. Mic-4 TaxID=3132826 RepID=UPI003CF719D9
MDWSEFLLWMLMLIQMLIMFIFIKLVVNFLNRLQDKIYQMSLKETQAQQQDDQNVFN